MALVVKDRVQETTLTVGTITLVLTGAVTGFQTFSSAIGNGNTTYYTIQGDGEWEVGIGTVGIGTLSRDTVLESSNSGSLVNFSAGSKFVFCTYPAEKSVYVDSSGNVNLTGNILLDNGNADGAQLTLASSGYSNWNLDNYSGRFRAYYNATEYFTIDASGNVGIGTSSPSTKLQVTKDDGGIFVSAAANKYATVSVGSNGNGYLTGSLDLLQSTTGDGYVFNRANNPLIFGTNNTERMRIDASGNVGIGTSTTNPAGFGKGVNLDGTSNVGYQVSVGGTFTGYFGAYTSETRIGSISTYPMTFYTNSTERMRIDSSGVITSTLGGMQVISGTSQNSTSGTALDFTGIPSWVKKITVMSKAVSSNGTSPFMIQLGTSGGFVTTGYLCSADAFTTTLNGSAFTNGFALGDSIGAAQALHGISVITRLTGNNWVFSSTCALSNGNGLSIGGGSIDLGAELTQIRYTTSGGTNTFDAGIVNILYE